MMRNAEFVGTRYEVAGYSQAQADSLYLRKNAVQVVATDYLKLGAAPGTTAAVNVDASSYGGVAFVGKNGAETFNINVSGGSTTLIEQVGLMYFGAAGESKWSVSGFAGTSQFVSAQTTARIVGGTNGLQVRDQANANNNGSFLDNGNFQLRGSVLLGAAATAGIAGQVCLGATVQTTVGAAGAASAQPALPLGYLVGYVGTTKVAIPYHNA
jgi:hypothetical protein